MIQNNQLYKNKKIIFNQIVKFKKINNYQQKIENNIKKNYKIILIYFKNNLIKNITSTKTNDQSLKNISIKINIIVRIYLKIKIQNNTLLQENQQILNQKENDALLQRQKYSFINFLNKKQKLRIHALVNSVRINGNKQLVSKPIPVNHQSLQNQNNLHKHVYSEKINQNYQQSRNQQNHQQNGTQKQLVSSKFQNKYQSNIYPHLNEYNHQKPLQKFQIRKKIINQQPNKFNSNLFLMDPKKSSQNNSRNYFKTQIQSKSSKQENFEFKKLKTSGKRQNNLQYQQKKGSNEIKSPKKDYQFIMMTKDKQKKKDHMPLSYNNIFNSNSQFMKPQNDKNLNQSQLFFNQPDNQIDNQPQIKINKNVSIEKLKSVISKSSSQQKLQQFQNRLNKIASNKSIKYAQQYSNEQAQNNIHSPKYQMKKDNQFQTMNPQNVLLSKNSKSPKYFDLIKSLQQNIRKKKSQNQELIKSINGVKSNHH